MRSFELKIRVLSFRGQADIVVWKFLFWNHSVKSAVALRLLSV